MEALGKGIEEWALYPVHADRESDGKIWDYIPHLPAKERPFRDLSRIRIVETIAETMKPGVLNAMRTVAAARMIAAPMMIGGGTAAASCQGIVIDARIMTVNVDAGTNAGDFKKALREHQQEIGRIVERAFEQNKRSKF